MLKNSKEYPNEGLKKLAIDDAQHSGKGRANAVSVLDMEEIQEAYRWMPLERRDSPIRIGEHWLEGNMAAVLKG